MTAATSDKVVQEISSILEAYEKAVLSWDRDAINEFWGDSDGFVFAGDGTILGGHSEWADTLDQYEKQVERWLKFKYTKILIEPLSIDAATATTEFEHSRITVEGDKVNIRGSWTYVFKKQNGKWNVLHSNGTHVEF
jgi:ketosteroid isomerase-like protein